MSGTPTIPQRALDLGHDLVWDPPAAITSVWRWTCRRCDRAVLDRAGVVYGSAVEAQCVEVDR
jgi:hypothetical protein